MITRSPVIIPERATVSANLFGYNFPCRLEPFIFNVASEQAMNYGGGYWAF